MQKKDYYKILNIQRNASFQEIRTAYRNLALKYHPDKNPRDSRSENIFKKISEAYNILSNPDKKQLYDRRLASGQVFQRSRTGRMRPKTKEEMNREAVEQYDKARQKLPFGIRYFLCAMSILWGIQLTFSHWFINEAGYDMLFIVVGIALFLSGTFFFYKTMYMVLSVKNINTPLRYNFGSVVIIAFFLTVITGPLSVWGLSEVQKQYHFKHYAVITEGKIVAFDYQNYKVIYEFYINKKLIRKSHVIKEGEVFVMEKPIMVEYSYAHPTIVRIKNNDR